MLKNKFKQTEIGNISEEPLKENCIEIQYGYTQSASEEKVGPKFLRITDIQDKIINWQSVPYCKISKEDYKKYKLEDGNILIARTGASTGTNTIYREGMPDAVFASYLIRIRVNSKLISRFVYYFLQSQNYRKHILSNVGGSAQPNANAQQLTDVLIPLFPLQEQHSIASILGSLDDKIALNRAMNSTLEAMGQALFRRWFVDFEFPNEEGKPYKSSGGEMVETELGDVPKGWEVKPIDKIAEFLNGLALQKYPPKDENFLPVIKIRELRQGTTESSDKASPNIDKKYIVEDGDILFSWSGSLEVCIWCGGKGALNQHLFKVSSDVYPKWFFYQWIKFYLPEFQHIAEGKATTMGHIQRHHLAETLVAIPPKEVFEKMNKIMNPLIEKYISNAVEARNLSQIRDALLPKLMSGEIRVPIED